MVQDSSWDLGSGLHDDFDATIVLAYFGYNPEYDKAVGGNTPLLLLTLDDGEEQFEQGWSMGKGLDVMENGARIERPGSDRVNIIKSTNLGKLIQKVAELKPELKGTIIPRIAKTWEGHRFHWNIIKQTFGKDHLMPTAYLGKVSLAKTMVMDENLRENLTQIAKETTSPFKFIQAAAPLIEGLQDETLNAHILDMGAGGFYMQARQGVGV